MSEHFGTELVPRVVPVRDGGGQGATYASVRHAPPHEAAHTGHDGEASVVMGLHPALQRPEVLAALNPLLEEMERLRGQVTLDNRHLHWLEHQNDGHPVAPCLNRRAFLRELELWLDGGGEGCVAVLHVAGVEDARRIHGLGAAEMLLQHTAAIVNAQVRAGDLVGCLGLSDFAVVLPNASAEDARVRLEMIVQYLTAPAPQWQDHDLPVRVLFGLWLPQAGQNAPQVLAAADAALVAAAGS